MRWFHLFPIPVVLAFGILATSPLSAWAQHSTHSVRGRSSSGGASHAPNAQKRASKVQVQQGAYGPHLSPLSPRYSGALYIPPVNANPAYTHLANSNPSYANRVYLNPGYASTGNAQTGNDNISVIPFLYITPSPTPASYVRPVYVYPMYSPPPPISHTSGLPVQSVIFFRSTNQSARIEMRLPTVNAQVWVNGEDTATSGTQRVYFSPRLVPGYAYSYDVVATWRRDGRVIRAERTVDVAPGETTVVDFTQPDTGLPMPLADD